MVDVLVNHLINYISEPIILGKRKYLIVCERRGRRSSGVFERRGHRSSGIFERRGRRSSGICER